MPAKKKSVKPPTQKSSNGNVNAGKSPRPRPPQQQQKTTLSPSSVLLAAIVAFLGGVLTPPTLHVLSNEGASNSSSPQQSHSSAPDIDTSRLTFPLPPHVPCIQENLENYLHDAPVHGLHVVCVEQIHSRKDDDGYDPSTETSDDDFGRQRILDHADSLKLTFYKGAHKGPLLRRAVVGMGVDDRPRRPGGGVQSISWGEVKGKLIQELGLASAGPTQQPWAVFTAMGERIVGETDVLERGSDQIGSNAHVMNTMSASAIIVVTQGGKWIWPGVREGFERTVEIAPPKRENAAAGTSSSSDQRRQQQQPPRNITIETLSLKPLVVSIKGFLSDEECDYIAKKAGPSMKYSSVSLKDADKGRASSDWRTSQSTFLSAKDDIILEDIDDRTASLTRVPRNHQEFVQVLRYGTNEKYDAHHDYFDPQAYRSDKNTLNLIENGRRNRFATVFWYLTDVDEGGHTIFPRAGGLPPVRNHADCSRGLKVQPQKGKVIIFYSLDAAGKLDPYSLHGACPVGENNVKWAANKWIWNAPMGYVHA